MSVYSAFTEVWRGVSFVFQASQKAQINGVSVHVHVLPSWLPSWFHHGYVYMKNSTWPSVFTVREDGNC